MSPDNESISGLSLEQEQKLVQELERLEPAQDAVEQPSTLTDPVEIIDHGQIGRMVIPAGWVEVDSESIQGIGTRSSRMFQPIGEESVRLCIFYRGLPIADSEGTAFATALKRGPHELDEAEIRSISEVLGSKADPEHFQMSHCRVEDFKGRNVLTLVGIYLSTGERVMEMFIDADGSGRFVQQIYFQAPEELYEKYFRAAKSTLRSLEWRST